MTDQDYEPAIAKEPNQDWKIIFTYHFLGKYGQKLSGIDASITEDRLTREIKRAGIFYLHPRGGLVCIVNKLKVYGVNVDAKEKKLVLATTYRYSKTDNYEVWPRVNIPGMGKSCESGSGIETLIAEGARLQRKE